MPNSRPPIPRRWKKLLAVSAAVTLVAAVTATGWASPPTTAAGWSLVWSDDFTGPANTAPNPANWITDLGTAYPGGPGNWGTGEIQSFTADPENLALDGAGNLRMTPLRAPDGSWTSARVETVRANFKPAAGTTMAMEARIQMPNVTGSAALGYWPAFWALGSPYRGNLWNWPTIGEFDIMENVNGLDAVYGVLHCGTNPGGPCNETTGLVAHRACPGVSCQSAFHTYRFEWDTTDAAAEQLRWYVDGQQYHAVNEGQVDAETWKNMTAHAGYFLLLDLAIGGAFPNALAGNTPTAQTESGHSMLVDYVAVTTTGAGTTAPPPPTTSSVVPTPTTTASPTGTPTCGTAPPSPSPPAGTRDAYAVIEAESFNAQSGVQVEATTDTGGGQNITHLANGDWVRFDNVNFGSTTPVDFVARAASGATNGVSGLVEVRIDDAASPPIGSFAIANTGGWQSWRTVPANAGPVTGLHSVFLRFASGGPTDFVDLNWLQFRR